MSEEEKEELAKAVEEASVEEGLDDLGDLDETFPKVEAEEEEAEDEDEEEEEEDEEEDEKEDDPTPKPKKSPPKSSKKPNKKSPPQPKKESKQMAKKTTEEKSDAKMIRVSGEVAKRIYQLAAQIQLETGERTHPSDAISVAVEAALK